MGLLRRDLLKWVLASLCGLIFVAQSASFVRANSPTYDEPIMLAAGYAILSEGNYAFNLEHPPLPKILNALPVYLFLPALEPLGSSQDPTPFIYKNRVPAETLFAVARSSTVLLGGCLVALIGWWSYRFWNVWAGLLAMGLAAFEPNLLAHGSLVGNDLATTLFTTLTLYSCWEYLHAQRWPFLVATGAGLGLALVSKFSALSLIAALGLILAAYVLWSARILMQDGEERPLSARIYVAVRVMGVAMGMGFLVVVLCYHVNALPLYVEGVRFQLKHQSLGHTGYFLGEIGNDGWLSYFPVAYFLKTPPTILALLGLSVLGVRLGRPLGLRGVVFLVVPVAFTFLSLALVRANIGFRYALSVVPLLLIVASRAATIFPTRRGYRALFCATALASVALSVLRVAPHQLAYFNDLVGGAENGPKYLGDSNIDWGQDLYELRRFMAARRVGAVYLSYFGSALPGALDVRYQPLPPLLPRETSHSPTEGEREFLAVSVTNLQEMVLPPRTFAWLKERPPVSKLGYSMYIYDITGDVGAHVRLARMYHDSLFLGTWDREIEVGKAEAQWASRELERASRIDSSNDDLRAAFREKWMEAKP